MDLNALQLFVAAAEAGSFSAAARRTRVPLPTLSRRVRKLEDELGVRLLERGPYGLALTPAGTQLLAEATPALATLSQAEPMKPVFSEFCRRYPAVRLDVFVTDRRVDLVADGIDVVVRVGEGGYSSYVGRTLARYRHRVVGAPSLLEGLQIDSPADLLNLACACWRTGGSPSWTMGDVELNLSPVLLTNDYAHLLHMAVSGQAITEVPPFMARDPLDDGRLVEILPDYPMPLQTIRALVVDTRALSPLVRQFLDFAANAVPRALGGLD